MLSLHKIQSDDHSGALNNINISQIEFLAFYIFLNIYSIKKFSGARSFIDGSWAFSFRQALFWDFRHRKSYKIKQILQDKGHLTCHMYPAFRVVNMKGDHKSKSEIFAFIFIVLITNTPYKSTIWNFANCNIMWILQA